MEYSQSPNNPANNPLGGDARLSTTNLLSEIERYLPTYLNRVAR